MDTSKVQKGDRKATSKKKGKKGQKGETRDNINDDNSTVSFDSDFDTEGNFEILQSEFNKKLLAIENKFKGEVDALYKVINMKEETIGKLQVEIGALQQSCNYLTEETSVLHGRIKELEVSRVSAAKQRDEIREKATDLEDRSRRNNIVFFNIPEETNHNNDRENCEDKIKSILHSQQFFDREYEIPIDWAHRLG